MLRPDWHDEPSGTEVARGKFGDGGLLVVVWMPFVTSGSHCRLELRTP